MKKISLLIVLFVCLVCLGQKSANILAEQIQLSIILPKLEAIHEDAQTLLIKNAELKSKILLGLQAQNEAKLKLVKGQKFGEAPIIATTAAAPPTTPPVATLPVGQQTVTPQVNIKQQNDKNSTVIDYAELEEFNKWVEVNLDYAVKNTQASIESFKEEAQQNNGNVDYSELAIKDGIEGVKYWQSAVIFLDKTLKNEKTSQE